MVTLQFLQGTLTNKWASTKYHAGYLYRYDLHEPYKSNKKFT